MLAKALATRLSRVMPTVIHGDQTCSVPGRSIRDSCRLLQDVVDYCEAIDQEAAFVSLDQEKAFDRVDWSYLDRVLTAMNFGPVFRSYVSTLYNCISSRVVVNGWLSRRNCPTMGVRQGCPLSPILYVLIAETLGSLVRSSPFSGLPLPASVDRLKVIQYADDTTVVASSDTDFAVLEDCLSTYQKGSGAKLNISKSRGLFFGSWRERSDSPLSLTWTAGSIKILDIMVGPSVSLNLVNWQSAIDKMRAVFRAWQHRDLSIGGRALVARAFATSKLWYVAQVVPAPLSLQDNVNSSVWNFIWEGHAALVSRRVCCRHPRAGGFGGVLIRDKVAAFQLQWIARLIDDRDERWKYLARFWFDVAAHPFCDHRGLLAGNVSPVSRRVPPFYSALIKTYRRYRDADRVGPTAISDVLQQPLFGNPSIVDLGGRPLYSRAMADAGMTRVLDIYSGRGWIDIAHLQATHNIGHLFLRASYGSFERPFLRPGYLFRMPCLNLRR